MSDDLETVEETVDAPETEQPDLSEDSEDVGALKRAYERVKEKHRSESAIWDDEDAVFERVRDKFPHWLEDTGDDVSDDEDEDEDDSPDPSLELKREVDELKAAMSADKFERDLKDTLEGRALAQQGRDWLRTRRIRNKEELGKAVKAWFEFEDGLSQSALERLKTSKKTRHVSTSGKAATQVPNLDDDKERRRYMKERLAQLHAGE